MRGKWVPPDTRDEVMDFVNDWEEKADFPASWFIRRLGIGSSKI